jgi:hypothetical protein
MEDVGSLMPEQKTQLDESREIAPWPYRSSHVLERDEANSSVICRLAQRTFTIRGQHDIEMLDECRQQRRHIGLSAADLSQSD